MQVKAFVVECYVKAAIILRLKERAQILSDTGYVLFSC